jgi:hypothetical protein
MTPDEVLAKAYALSGPRRRMWRAPKPLKVILPSGSPSSSAKAKPDDILAAATMHSQRTPRVWGPRPMHHSGSPKATTTKRKTHDLLDAHNEQPGATPLLDHGFTKPATRPRSGLALADLMEDCVLHDKLSAIVERERPPLSSDSESDLDDDSVALVRQALYQGIPANTVKAELSAWKSWSAACGRLHLSRWRGRKAGHKESLKLGRIVLDIYHHMRPRRRTDPAAKPESAYKVYLNVRRLMKREGYECPPVPLVRAAVKGLVVDYIKRHGFRTLVPKRAAAFSAEEAHKLRGIPHGTTIGPWRLRPNSLATASWRCLNSTLFNTGMRSDEVCTASKKAGLTKKMLTRASLVFRIGASRSADPTPTQLASLTTGDGVYINVRPSKTDADGSFWCDKPIWLPFDTHPSNACNDFVRMELQHPCAGATRSQVALFANDDGSPFAKYQIDAALKDALHFIGLGGRKESYTWHSYRVTLACLLDAAGCPPPLIKKMVRWISDESLRTYVRPNDTFISFWLNKIVDATISTTQARDLPHVEEERFQQQALFVHDLGVLANYDATQLDADVV